MANKIRNNGGDVVFLFPEHENTSSEGSWTHWIERKGFKVYTAPLDLSLKDQEAFIKGIIDDHDVRIIHNHFLLFHTAVTENAKRWGVKVLIHDHMGFDHRRSKIVQVARCAARSLQYRFQGVSVVSCNKRKTAAFSFARRWYVPNGISFGRICEYSDTRELCRKKLGVPDEQKMCLLFGWAFDTKGVDIAIKAVNEVRKSNPKVILGIVGLGSQVTESGAEYIVQTTGIDPNSPWLKYLPAT